MVVGGGAPTAPGSRAASVADGLFVYLGSRSQVKLLQGSDWLGEEPMGGPDRKAGPNSWRVELKGEGAWLDSRSGVHGLPDGWRLRR